MCHVYIMYTTITSSSSSNPPARILLLLLLLLLAAAQAPARQRPACQRALPGAHRVRGTKSGSMAAAAEAWAYSRLDSWTHLLECMKDHMKATAQQNLAIHASTACQPQKAEALVPDLMVAGLQDAHVNDSGAWTCTLTLPALFQPGDNHPVSVTCEGRSKGDVVQDPV